MTDYPIDAEGAYKKTEPHIFTPYFRIFTINSVLNTVRKGDYMRSK